MDDWIPEPLEASRPQARAKSVRKGGKRRSTGTAASRFAELDKFLRGGKRGGEKPISTVAELGLTPAQALVWVQIWSNLDSRVHPDYEVAVIGRDLIAERCNLKLSMVKRALTFLKKHGLVQVVKEGKKAKRYNHYRVFGKPNALVKEMYKSAA